MYHEHRNWIMADLCIWITAASLRRTVAVAPGLPPLPPVMGAAAPPARLAGAGASRRWRVGFRFATRSATFLPHRVALAVYSLSRERKTDRHR